MMRAIAIEVADSQIRACLLIERDLRPYHLITDGQPLGVHPDINATLRRVRSAADKVLGMTGLEWKDITGIGVTVPNPINRYGVVTEGTRLRGWTGIHAKHKLELLFPEIDATNIAVYNDQHAVALAELEYGEGQNRPSINLVCFIITAGIGAGIIIDGKLQVGASGAAGEIGHVVIDPAGPPCGICGKQSGCLETISSGTAMAKRAASLIEDGKGTGIFETVLLRTETTADDGGGYHDFQNDTLEAGRTYRVWARDVITAAKQGDSEAIEIVEKAGQGLGRAIVMILHTLNPQIVVVGGLIGRAIPIYLDAAEIWVRNSALRSAKNDAVIVPSRLEDRGPLYGAAAGVFASMR